MPYLLSVPLVLLVLVGHTKARPEQRSSLLSADMFVPPPGQRCSGRNFQGRRCCTPENPCDEGEGDCDGRGDGGQHDGHEGCKGDLICGSNNCRKFGAFYHEKDDCCEKPSVTTTERLEPGIISGLPFEPPLDQRCSGRNYQGRRCCTPENPCNKGEGDCDGPGDGGGHDGHAGCKGDLVCGSNNCKKFGLYFHEKDDCCDQPSSIATEKPAPVIVPGVPLDPPAGQRCRGRNYDGRRCCTPEQPCGEGEGDCDGRGDGGLNDGDRGCRGALVCGSNNCTQFGAYYHEKDDCCEKPATVSAANPGPRQQSQGWGQWTQWGPCSASCGAGWKVRTKKCVGSRCGSAGFPLEDRQERLCIAPDCNNL